MIGADAGSLTDDFHFPMLTLQAAYFDFKYNPIDSRFQERPIQPHLRRIPTYT
jgi:hypothetical protein